MFEPRTIKGEVKVKGEVLGWGVCLAFVNFRDSVCLAFMSFWDQAPCCKKVKHLQACQVYEIEDSFVLSSSLDYLYVDIFLFILGNYPELERVLLSSLLCSDHVGRCLKG